MRVTKVSESAPPQVKRLQNENEREGRREREHLQEKNNTLNKEITRLTMAVSHNQENNVAVDTSMLDRVKQIEREYDEVGNSFTSVYHSEFSSDGVRCPRHITCIST